MEYVFIYILLGAASGFLAGLLGIGGGFVIVPSLYYLFIWKGFPKEYLMHVVIATSLSSICVTTLISTLIHTLKRTIFFRSLYYFLPGIVFGCLFGAFLATEISSDLLKKIFGFFAILIGLYFIYPHLPYFKIVNQKFLIFLGIIVGSFSTLLGIGGGVFSVPIFLAYQIPMKNVGATSSVATFVSSLIGSLLFFILGWNLHIAGTTWGYIDLTSFIAISIGSIFFTAFGVKCSQIFQVSTMKRIFGLVLSITGIIMLWH